MTIKVAINGFGRMGRLAFRAAWDWPEFEIVHINEKAGDAATAAHLLNFDSVHGRWQHAAESNEKGLLINGQSISYSQNAQLEATPWHQLGVDIVVECTGKFKSKQALAPYLQQGVKKVVVSAPVKDGTLNIVMGVNDQLYDPAVHNIVTAASCTTNCIAPVVKVIHENFGIKHGSITTIHDMTNTQSILDEYHPDLRRARASALSLIPTSTGSATAITEIFPELKGRLNGIAVRVPLANASLTDCVFEVEQAVTVEAINAALKTSAEGELNGILGYETRPLVSADYTNDTHSSTVDALSTMVVNGTQVKILTWYDNEIGYVHRMMELCKKLALSLS
ncbi:ArsJ-associated glyceraldehyde-3-phosphate dehydrogenase [Methyloprofundus sp.]|uniref:ArsJ-associated glyceraldehyde-3-phosphate dehydrogenase n=1 Tax=Methyloprofundus sp. TaxID=2020875 RepID=UPI003D14F73E